MSEETLKPDMDAEKVHNEEPENKEEAKDQEQPVSEPAEEKPEEKPEEAAEEAPAEESAEQPAEEKPQEKPSEKPQEKAVERPADPLPSQDLEEDDDDYSPEERQMYTRLYEETLSDIAENEIVTGRVLAISEKEVAVDIGFKSEGTIPIDEFDSVDDIRVGEEIEVFLDSVEDQDGQLVLSKKKADFTRVWEKVMEMHSQDQTIKGKCLRRIKGGLVVDLMGIDAFLPGSQIDVKPIRDFDAFIGQELEFKVVKVNHLRKNIVVSRRVLIEESLKEQRGKVLEELEKGQVREGMVKNITDFGVFVDLGGVDGLLHITDLSWGRVSHPSEIVQFDQKIKVKVLDFDENKERISLGMKQLQPHPWENIEGKYPVGNKIEGRVVSITDYGAFVELEKGIEGLIHISEMSWTQHIKHPSKLLSIGDKIEAIILNVDKDERKISLGLKQIEPDPWEEIEKKYPVGSKHTGIVRNLTNFGAFIELEEGIDGLVHISDLSWTKKIRHPGEVVKKGDTIEVIVLDISKEERRISLGHKQVEDNPWDHFQDSYKVGNTTTGKVSRMIEKGAIVELPLGVEAFLPTSHFSLPKGLNQYDPGAEIPLMVIEFDKTNKKIVLSHSEYEKAKEKEEVDEYMKKQAKESDKEEAKEKKADKASDKDSEKDAAEEVKEEKTEKAEPKKTAKKEKPEEESVEEVKEEAEEAVKPEKAEEKKEEEPEKAEKAEKKTKSEKSDSEEKKEEKKETKKESSEKAEKKTKTVKKKSATKKKAEKEDKDDSEKEENSEEK